MTVIVRTYKLLNEPDNSEPFYARAIAQGAKATKPTEGFSVGFYADTAEGATAKARAWIEAERQRQEVIAGNRAAGARKTSSPKTGETPDASFRPEASNVGETA